MTRLWFHPNSRRLPLISATEPKVCNFERARMQIACVGHPRVAPQKWIPRRAHIIEFGERARWNNNKLKVSLAGVCVRERRRKGTIEFVESPKHKELAGFPPCFLSAPGMRSLHSHSPNSYAGHQNMRKENTPSRSRGEDDNDAESEGDPIFSVGGKCTRSTAPGAAFSHFFARLLHLHAQSPKCNCPRWLTSFCS